MNGEQDADDEDEDEDSEDMRRPDAACDFSALYSSFFAASCRSLLTFSTAK
jgi:hypothetical protein